MQRDTLINEFNILMLRSIVEYLQKSFNESFEKKKIFRKILMKVLKEENFRKI